MKALTVSQARACLGKLVDEAHKGAPVILIHKNKLVKLERYEPLDPEFDSPHLEAMLLDAVRGPHSVYARKDLEAAAGRARRRMKKR